VEVGLRRRARRRAGGRTPRGIKEVVSRCGDIPRPLFLAAELLLDSWTIMKSLWYGFVRKDNNK
jgi:hypothetical protein